MSTADQHRASAEEALDNIVTTIDHEREISYASEATAHALLAIEARLGELVEQQRRGNTIAALHQIGCYGDDEYMAARATVRAVLGLPPEGQNR
ncbi:hypothetical protein [Nocardia wallacei]|uniref:hypothetical protein n=1 Tax=Nocardia wallacei TaxID=480035 RepID=UPI0024563CD6|nr:hypothetical protein [Nocardia wallacei]